MLKDIYSAARELKGAGEGTDIGFWLSNFSTYNQILVSGFDFYNECNLDYYMVAVGSNLQNVSGLSNFGTTMAFRVLDSADTSLVDLQTAITDYASTVSDENLTALGEASGNLIRLVLSVEIPTTSDNEIAYYQIASSFA